MTRLTRLLLVALLALVAPACSDTAPTDLDPSASFDDDDDVDGKVRTYYIAAEKIAWDYAPSGQDLVMGGPFSMMGMMYVKNAPNRIGKTYYKAVYRAYTDETFTTPAEVPEEWRHLGTMGPVIRGTVGDQIRVVFRNNLPDRPVSMHPHGVTYAKDSEGTPYSDGTDGADKADDAVPPGGTHVYVWDVPKSAGPGPNDPSSIAWLYHSHTNEIKDTNTGLIGAIIITAKGKEGKDGRPKGVDREFVTLFNIYNENASWYLQENIQAFAGDPTQVDPADDGFQESNLMHAMNGWLFGNMPLESMRMEKGEKVRWYVMAMGSHEDLHTPHWHGNTVLWNGNRTDVVEILPASMKVVDMEADNPGIWMYHCHVNHHIMAGMMARYEVLP